MSRGPGPIRGLLYAGLVTLLFFVVANAAVELLERRGLVRTHRPDDAVSYVEERLFAPGDDPAWLETTPYGRRTMVASRFRADKGDAWRVFVLGGSFAMGSPYVDQWYDRPQEGGIPTFLLADLQRRTTGRSIEVINAGAGAQNSTRVAAILDEVLRYEPDVVLVATCNNEGAAAPGRVRAFLHEQGGYRLLASLLAPPPDRAERSYFTPRDVDTERIRRGFRSNLERMTRRAHDAGVPLLLATLPVNYRYSGGETGRGEDDAEGDAPEQVEGSDDGGETGDLPPAPCLAAASERVRAGDPEGALAALDECDADPAETLRWRGLALAGLGRLEEARRNLEQSIELVPRNRCPASANSLIREVAAGDPGAALVDMEAAAIAASPGGLPGYDLFLDFCHMRWQGYAAMAAEVVEVMVEQELLPAGARTDLPPLDPDELGRAIEQSEQAEWLDR